MIPSAAPRAIIVGAGLMGRWHADAARRAGATLVAIVDPEGERAQRLAARYRGAVAHERLEPALAGGGIDTVHVCTPLETHESVIRAAVVAGCHVLAEKPLAPTAAVTEELLGLAQDRGVLLCPVHQFLFQPGVLRAQATLAAIGPLRHLDAVACSAGADRAGDAERDRIAVEILPHPLSLIARFLPGDLKVLPWTARRVAPGELRALGGADGVSASILISMRGRPTANTLTLIGEHGTARLDLFHGFCVIEPGRVSRARKILHPFDLATRTLIGAAGNLLRRAFRAEQAYPGLRELVVGFCAAALQRKNPPISAQETLAVAIAKDQLLAMM